MTRDNKGKSAGRIYVYSEDGRTLECHEIGPDGVCASLRADADRSDAPEQGALPCRWAERRAVRRLLMNVFGASGSAPDGAPDD